jgi:hypothetical protein
MIGICFIQSWRKKKPEVEECIGDNKDMVEEVHYFWISIFWVVPCVWDCIAMQD